MLDNNYLSQKIKAYTKKRFVWSEQPQYRRSRF